MNKSYQVIIIGGVAVGLTAGLYCACSGIGVLLIEDETKDGVYLG